MLTMVSTSLIVMSFIQLTSSTSLSPSLHESRLIKVGESSNFAGQMETARGQSLHQHLAKPNLKAAVAELDIEHFKSVLEQKDRAPHFWKMRSFKSKPHYGWTNLDSMGRNISELNIIEKVKEIHRECLLLNKSLLSQKKSLTEITVMNKEKNAYEILEILLGQLDTLILGFFTQKHPRPFGKCSSVHKLHLEIKWKILVSHIDNSFLELRELYLYARFPQESSQEDLDYTLTNHVFKILNSFLKHQLIEEESFERWLNTRSIQELLCKHILEMFHIPSFTSLDFFEDLLRSKSSEHLGVVFKMLDEKFWKAIEYECFKKSMESVLGSRWLDAKGEELMNIARDFCDSGFEREELDNVNKQEATVEKIFHYLNTSTTNYVNRSTFITNDLLCKMLSFVIKYKKDLCTKTFENESYSQTIYLQLELLDASLKCLKSARELEFLAWEGLWTTEMYFKKSIYEITIEKAKSWVFVPMKKGNDFDKKFDCKIPKDFFEWNRIFEEDSLNLNETESKTSKAVNLESYGQQLPYWFGTNFCLKDKNGTISKCMRMVNEKDERVSTLFLTELHEWIEKLKLIHERFRQNQKNLIKITNMISLKNRANEQKSVNIWIKKSETMKGIMKKIEKLLVCSQAAWAKVKGKMKILDEKITSSPSGSQVQTHSVLQIPEFDLLWKLKKS